MCTLTRTITHNTHMYFEHPFEGLPLLMNGCSFFQGLWLGAARTIIISTTTSSPLKTFLICLSTEESHQKMSTPLSLSVIYRLRIRPQSLWAPFTNQERSNYFFHQSAVPTEFLAFKKLITWMTSLRPTVSAIHLRLPQCSSHQQNPFTGN